LKVRVTDFKAIRKEEYAPNANDSKDVVVLMAAAMGLKVVAEIITRVSFRECISRADAMGFNALWRYAVSSEATESKDVVSLRAKGIDAEVVVFQGLFGLTEDLMAFLVLAGVARAHGTEAGAIWTDVDVDAADVVDMGVVVDVSGVDEDGDLTEAMAADVEGVESLVAGPIAAVEIYGDENAFEKVVGSVVMLRKLSQMWLRCQRSEDAMA